VLDAVSDKELDALFVDDSDILFVALEDCDIPLVINSNIV
jgi:hypothetical protein